MKKIQRSTGQNMYSRWAEPSLLNSYTKLLDEEINKRKTKNEIPVPESDIFVKKMKPRNDYRLTPIPEDKAIIFEKPEHPISLKI